MADLYRSDRNDILDRALHDRAQGRVEFGDRVGYGLAGMAANGRTAPHERHVVTDEERDEREQRYRRRHAANGRRSICMVDGEWREYRFERTASGRWEPVLISEG